MKPGMLRIGFGLGLMLLALAGCLHNVLAQDHQHGVNVPDWYDSDCCDLQDCRPVPDTDVEEIDHNVFLHKPTGLEFRDTAANKVVRQSKDGRFHVCYRGTSRGNYIGYCIYIIQGGV